MIPLDEERLRRAVGPAAFEKGLEYVRKGRVLEAHVEPGGGVRGSVKGSEWKPYEQRVLLGGEGLDGRCTCPVGSNCKHVAAVLLDLLGQDEVVETPAPKADPLVATWLQALEDAFADPNAYPADVPQRVYYVLTKDERGVVVELMSARLLASGGHGKPSRLSLNPLYSKAWPRYVLPVDVRLIEALVRGLGRSGYESKFRLVGLDGGRLLPEIVATGRARWTEIDAPPLLAGPRLQGELAWRTMPDGSQTVVLSAQGLVAVATTPAYYVDVEASTVGEFELDLPASLLSAFAGAPPVRPESVETVRAAIERLVPGRPDLLPKSVEVERRQVRPTPTLRIEMREATPVATSARKAAAAEGRLPMARLAFDYDGVEVRQGAAGAEVRKREGERIVVMPRRSRLEGRASTPLLEGGWTPGRLAHNWRLPTGHGDDYVFLPEDRHAFYRFLRFEAPALREEGWRVEVGEGLEIAEASDWRLDVTEGGADWFDLDLGVEVDGERVPLRPILVDALALLNGRRLEELPEEFELYHELPGGRILVLPAARLRPLLRTLGELFGRPGDWPREFRLGRAAAAELALLDESGLVWSAPARLKELRDRLAEFDAPRPVEPPPSLKGDLRPYQLQGLAWLQFLREYGFGGILADDMGLGKTVQTLAHILVERDAGRLDRPALIVAPTSTLPNWRAEAERFAPSLRTLVLRGADRRERFDEIADHDLIVTSYPLLARDRELLTKVPFHLVVLDEAQNVKNPASAASAAVRALDARHRLCLSGTPVENRLEELWSLFDFLMPGFLGSLSRFKKEFKSGDDPDAARRLARRVRPFVLRRTKDVVARDLPEKTVVVERVELSGDQRDLYESLRLTMDDRVRELLAAKGFDRSRIQILDALLKLRQACCDPRLVRLDAAKEVRGSAKLDRLMELLAELLAEGRRVLLFSQFTSMLDLIEEELRSSPLPSGGEGPGVRGRLDWVRLDGSTEDRETPVRRFQAGEVPLFLISLRAGGTGLNLTAADTVIHYDPWWNPAVEAQATDRAHRIGQKNAVLVIKLVAEGTVEEKILELQDAKSRLAESVLSGDFEQALTADELAWVLDDPGGPGPVPR